MLNKFKDIFTLLFNLKNPFLGWIGIFPLFVIFLNDFFIITNSYLVLLFALLTTIIVCIFCQYTFFKDRLRARNQSNVNIINLNFFVLFIYTIISLVLSVYLCLDLLRFSLLDNLSLYFIVFICGALAFAYLPQLCFLFQVTVNAIFTMNFFYNNFYAIYSSYGIQDIVCLALFFVLLFIKFKNSQQDSVTEDPIIVESLLFLLAYTLPLIIAFIIQHLSAYPFFCEFYYSPTRSNPMLMVVLVCIGLILIGFSVRYFSNQKVNNIAKGTVALLLSIMILFFPVKLQASKYREAQIGNHQYYYNKALSESQLPGEGILLLKKSAQAGNPLALYEVARYTLEENIVTRLKQDELEEAFENLLLSASCGNIKAIKLLKEYEDPKEDTNILVQLRNKLQPVNSQTLLSYYATLNLALLYHKLSVADNYNLSDDDKVKYFNESKTRFEKIINNPISNLPEVYLAIFALQNQENTEAITRLKELAKQGNTEATFFLGKYLLTQNVESNTALVYLENAKNLNHADATVLLSIYKISSPTISISEKKEARASLQRMVEELHPYALITTAKWHITKFDEYTDVEKGINTLKYLSSQGDSMLDAEPVLFDEQGLIYPPEVFAPEVIIANYLLATIYFQGKVVQTDYLTALHYLEKTTQKYHIESQELIKYINLIK